MKTALILGINGQTGSYLAEVLLREGYKVHGLVRRTSTGNLSRIEYLLDRIELHCGDLLDTHSLVMTYEESNPDEVYNMADQDEVGYSYACPTYAADVTYKGVIKVLEIILSHHNSSPRVYQPVSATMFADVDGYQNEKTPLDPQSPYAVAKAAAYHACRYYRKRYGMRVSTGICYNHDSPRRGPNYLLQKICREAVRIKKELEWDKVGAGLEGTVNPLTLYNLQSKVEIGFAGDYAEAAYRMLQQPAPDDYVLSTGRAYTIESLVLEAFRQCGMDREEMEKYVKETSGEPTPLMLGDNSKAVSKGIWDGKYDAFGMVGMLCEHLLKQK